MAGMFQLANVLELIIDGLDQGARAEQNFIQARLHLFWEFGDELYPLRAELREEGLGDVTPIPKQFAEQAASKLRHGLAVIDVARRELHGQESPAVVNDERHFEALEPARAGDPALSYVLENLMRFDTQVVARPGAGSSQ